MHKYIYRRRSRSRGRSDVEREQCVCVRLTYIYIHAYIHTYIYRRRRSRGRSASRVRNGMHDANNEEDPYTRAALGAPRADATGNPVKGPGTGNPVNADAPEGDNSGWRGQDSYLDEDLGETCFVCLDGRRDAILLECGHGGLCVACAQSLWARYVWVWGRICSSMRTLDMY
jgi:hypothetical protein